MRRTAAVVGILLCICLCGVAAAANNVSITLKSGNGIAGGLDNAIIVSMDGGVTWQSAYVIAPHPYYSVIPGTQYVNYMPTYGNPGYPGPCRFQTTFTLPDGFGTPSLQIQVHADNYADIYLNGVLIGQQPHTMLMSWFLDPPESFLNDNAALFLPGLNTLELDLFDPDGIGGLDYLAQVTYSVGLVADAGGPYWTGPGYAVTLNGSGSGVFDNSLANIVSWEWDLDNDGTFEVSGETTSFSRPTIGDYPVALRVTDSTNRTATTSTVVHAVDAPSVSVSQPVAGGTAFFGDTVVFSGTYSASSGTSTYVGGNAAGVVSLQWYSDRDGVLSSAAAFSTSALSVGTHILTCRATDNIGRTGEASVTFTVHPTSDRVDLVLEWGDITFWKDGQEITNPAPGDVVTVRANVHNLSPAGAQPVSVQFTDLYDGSPVSSVVVTDNAPIPAWGAQAVSFAWTAPPQEGYHVFNVQAAADATETYTANNRATHFIVVGTQSPAGKMSIAVSGLQPSGSFQVSPGGAFTVSGVAQYHWANSAYDLPLMGGRVTVTLLGGTWETRTLGDPSSGFFSQTITAPSTPGYYTARITVSDATLSTYADIPIQVPAPPGINLAVGSIWLENQVAGAPETVRAYIVNRGGLAASGAFTNHVRILGPTGALVFEGDAVVAGGLGAGAGAYVSFTGWTPDAAGSYQVTVMADSTDAVAESNETDNSMTASFHVYPDMVDLEVLDVRRTCFRVYALVRNNGGLNASGVQATFSDELGPFGSASYGVLPGKGYSAWMESASPYNGTTTAHVIRAAAQPAVEPDGNPANNEKSITLVFDYATDLSVTDLWVNGLRWSNNVVYQDVPATLDLEVANLGCLAGSGNVSFTVDGVSVGSARDVNLAGAGSAGASTTISVPHTFLQSEFPSAVNYQLKARVTPTAPTADAVPGNNERTESLTVSPQLPDYQVVSAGITFSVDPALRHPARNEKFGIRAQVCNVGRMAGEVFQVGFYEEGREQIGVVQTIDNTVDPANMPLAVGACMTVMPKDAAGQEAVWGSGFSGNHTILVSAAPVASIQDDPNDTNNQATRKVWVNHPPAARIAESSRRTVSKPGDTVTFSAAGSNDALDLDGLGGVVRYEWDFGDGAADTTTVPTVDHTFGSMQTFNVTVRAVDTNDELSDPAGLISTQSWTYTITATPGANGAISPSGEVTVVDSQSQTFTITPNPNYHVADVLVDNVSVGAVSTYTFANVTADHAIRATFAIDTRTITASASPNGSISPSGSVLVEYGASRTFTITPDAGYHVADVFVDNVSVGADSIYRFDNVTANRTIVAVFDINRYTIAASAAPNGSISPSGDVVVLHGASQAFTITPADNYRIADVVVDGVSMGPVTGYTFPDVTDNHAISASFSDYPAVTLLSPNGGEIIPSGAAFTIGWGAPATAVKFNLSYTLNGTNYTSIANGVTGTSYVWQAPSPSANSALCRVKIVGINSANKSVGNDVSDGTFTIEVVRLTSPNGGNGQSLTVGSVVPITWTTNGTSKSVNKVILSYSTDGGSAWTTITTIRTGNPGTFDWTVPNAPGAACKVRVALYNNNSAIGSDASDSDFVIAP